MGIYPDEKWTARLNPRPRRTKGEVAPQTATLAYHEPGRDILYVYELIAVFDERTDCFCCSCSDGSNDAHCRNHGFFARRPCDVHGMPGELHEPDEEYGETFEPYIPESTQKHRALPDGVTSTAPGEAEF